MFKLTHEPHGTAEMQEFRTVGELIGALNHISRNFPDSMVHVELPNMDVIHIDMSANTIQLFV